MEPLAATVASQCLEEETQKPDFNGKWKMVQHEGDWDAFLQEMGVSWVARMAFTAAGHGTNTTFNNIRVSGLHFSIESRTFLSSCTSVFEANGHEQYDMCSATNTRCKIVPYWEESDDGSLILTTQRLLPVAKDGAITELPLVRRWLDGKRMVVEWKSLASGVVVQEYFVKVAS